MYSFFLGGLAVSIRIEPAGGLPYWSQIRRGLVILSMPVVIVDALRICAIMKANFLAVTLLVSSSLAMATEQTHDPTEIEYFEKKIRPILAAR